MDYVLMGVAVIIIIAALMYFRKFLKDQNKLLDKAQAGGIMFVNCPVCGTLLRPGQNLLSKVFRSTQGADDQLCYIYGCPNCYPSVKNGVTRACPVCKKSIEQEGYLIARLFNKTKSGKPHVIINGCGNCNRLNRK